MRQLLAVVLLLFALRLADSQTYNIATFAGGGMPVNIPATTAALLGSGVIAADQAGNVYLVNGNTVLRWGATSGVMTLVAGNGTTGSGGDNGPAISAQLNPGGLAVDPAAGSTVIQIYCTGLGAVTNQPATGSAALSDPLSWTAATPNVTISGAAGTVLFSGLAPGAVGEYQVNVLVPAGASKGDAVPVTIQIGGLTSNTATIAVQ
jgi:hypothetical protein